MMDALEKALNGQPFVVVLLLAAIAGGYKMLRLFIDRLSAEQGARITDLQTRIVTIESHVVECNEDRMKLRDMMLAEMKEAKVRGDDLASRLVKSIEAHPLKK